MWFRSRSSEAGTSSAARVRKSNKSRRRRPTERLRLEALESRCLLTFMAPVNYSGGQAVVAADLTNNGVQDLVTCLSGNSESAVGVSLGKGDGTFESARTFPTGTGPFSAAVGDLTGNGKLDIVTGNSGYTGAGFSSVNPSLSVLLGNGDGTFQAPLTFALAGFRNGIGVSVAIGDMNHDGRLDVVVAGEAATTANVGIVDVFLGQGNGTFSLASTTQLSDFWTETMKLGDFNADGNLDVVVSGLDSGGVAVLQGNGDGTLGAPTDFVTGGRLTSLAVGDVNGDGKLDIVAVNNDFDDVAVLLGNGDGTFQRGADVAASENPRAVVMGDVNGDGKMDLAVAGFDQYTTGPYTGYTYYGTPYTWYGTVTDPNVNVLLGNGDGAFTWSQTLSLSYADYPYGENPNAITMGDFNGDAFADLAVSGAGGGSVRLTGANWAPPAPAASSFSLSGFPTSTQAGRPGTFAVTALNADGTVDTAYTGTVRFNSSDGQAALPAVYTFTAADAGKHTFSGTLKTAGTQSITATDASTGTVSGSETGIGVTPASASHFAVSSPAGSTAGNAFSVIVTALDPYNNVATGYASTVHFTSSDGLAGLPADYTFTANDAGVHTFTSAVTLKTAGSQTVAATDASTGSIMGSTTVAVSPATASTMIVTGFPSPITAGVAGSFTVTLKDAYGNVATAYTGTVRITSSDARAVLPANYTFTSGDAGKHTFSATLKTAGTQSITATDTVNASLHGTDSGITVKPAAASKFVLNAPASVQPGVPFSLTVTVEDAYGNIVTGYVGTVHFSSSDSQAHLPANYTFTAADNGVHTFTGVVLRKAGNQTITATDTKNSSITGKTVVDVL
ncbi:MAG TPA: VCBS repeat-containing protein [Pirellulales bacterium]|nr:VCBS repeat-containing protein [Pirellulales bacterium]